MALISGASEPGHGRLKRRNDALWLALFLLAVVGAIFFKLQITHDAAWQMWIGRQLLHGANLYSEITEINPPLWFWIAEPLSAMATKLGILDLHVLVSFFLACIATSLILIDRLLPEGPQWRRALLLIAFVVVALLPGNFAQREHFTFIATVPYVLLIGRRNSVAKVPAGLATLVGCFAAFGLALKPQFAFVPLVLELWLRRPIIRPETIVLAIAALVYAAAVALFEPDYLTKMLPLAQQAYGKFGSFNAIALLPTILPFVVALAVRPDRSDCSRALLIASLAFYLIHVSQLKGFAYQAIPAMGMLALALAASASAKLDLRNALAFGAAVLAISPNLAPYRTPAWADVPPGASYATLSVAPRAAWPLVEERGLKWPLRSMSLWMAPAVGDAIRPWVTKDLRCNPPDYLLVDDREVAFSAMFRDLLTDYIALSRHNGLTLMKLARKRSRPSNCRVIF